MRDPSIITASTRPSRIHVVLSSGMEVTARGRLQSLLMFHCFVACKFKASVMGQAS